MKLLLVSAPLFTRTFALAAVLALPTVALAKIIRTVEKTFVVEPGGTLTVTAQGGDVRVQTGPARQVRVTARETIRAGSEKEADRLLERLTLKLEQQGNNVSAEAKFDAKAFGFRWGSAPVRVDFVITVPEQFHADLRTSGGDITVGSLAGEVRARSSGGDLKFARITGGLDAATSGGDVELEESTARTRIATSGGDIHIGRAGGPTEVSTSGGEIEIEGAEQLRSAHTSGGGIRVAFARALTSDCVLSTSGGEVEVRVVAGAGFTLDAQTSGGEVDARGLTLTIDRGGPGKSRLAGTVHGGGPQLKLRASGGDITIRAE